MCPLFDYQCIPCGTKAVDIYRSVREGATFDPPQCESCLEPMQWIPQVGGIDLLDFDCYDGRNQKVHVSGLKQLRRIEKESEVHARNGEGQPMVWRKYSQDSSNVHVSTLGKSPEQAPTREAAEKFGKTLQKSAEAPERSFGPGVSEANASALKE